ncbi:MAG TPA: energy transducer TonB [Terriglobales bacterium]|nr:energy transducer TonB [Terriglobales bacterium]
MSVHTHSRLQMPTAGSKPALEGAAPQFMQNRESPVLPTLFGDGYGLYQTRPETFLLSFVAHVLVIALLVASGHFIVAHRQQIQQQVVNAVTDISPYILPASNTKAGGGGGGGDRDKLQASKGALPKFSREQITPPAAVIRNENPKLAVEPTVVVPPQIHLPQTGVLGDPLSAILGPPSNGPGFGGGIGSGSGGGVGSGVGPGVGPGRGGGIGGGVYSVGGGVSAPKPIYAPDPDYSEEARKAKYQGTVVLWVIVGADGHPHDIRVYRSLGMGLDEKAIEAIKTWKFEPARKDGIAVAVQVNIEVSFRLY